MQVYVNPFLAATIKVLSTMAMTDAKPGKPYVKQGKAANGVISAIIDLTGGTNGSISITFTKECIIGVVNNMLGESYDDLNDDIADAVGELVNMVSGEARRALAEQGFVFHAGIPRLIQGEGHLIEHSINGTVAVIPLKTDAGVFNVEASFASQAYFDEAIKTQELASVKANNSSLIEMELQSFLAKDNDPFKSYLLKLNSQVMKPNFFLIPEYVGATEGNEFCNFTALEVNVCPKSWFASTNLNYFQHSRNPNNPLIENSELHKLLVPGLNSLKLLGELPKDMFTAGRTVEHAILAYNLAIRTSELLFRFDPQAFHHEQNKIGEYALKAALLSKLQKVTEREKEFLHTAVGTYLQVLDQAKGENFFRFCFRLTALHIYLEAFPGAAEMINRMVKYFQQNAATFPKDSLPRIKRYIQLADKIYKERTKFTISKNLDRTNYLFLD